MPGKLPDLRLFERLGVPLLLAGASLVEDSTRVVHSFVQPKPEELVAHVVRDLDLCLRRSHRASLSTFLPANASKEVKIGRESLDACEAVDAPRERQNCSIGSH